MYIENTMEPITPAKIRQIPWKAMVVFSYPKGLNRKLDVAPKDKNVPYITMYDPKNFNKFLLLLIILNDSITDDFSDSAPAEGGVIGFFLINSKIKNQATTAHIAYFIYMACI